MAGPGFPGWGPKVERDGFDALGFDPAPGSLSGVDTLVKDLKLAAKELNEARGSVQRASRNGQAWQGEAADAFSARIAKLPGQLDTAHASFASASATMAGWREQLAAMQTKADDQEARAKAAKAKRKKAADDPDLKLGGLWFDDGQKAQEATAKLRAAEARLKTADAELDVIIAQAEELRAEHDRVAQEAAQAVGKAGDAAPDGPGWFAKLMDGVKQLAAAHIQLAKDAAKWAKDHANAIAAVGDLLSNASTLVGLAAVGVAAAGVFFPPLEAAAAGLGAVSMGLSGAALGAHAVAKAAGADVPPLSLAVDVMGVVPVIGTVGKTGKLATSLFAREAVGNGVSLGGTGITLDGWSKDAAGLQQFLPRDGRQWGELLVPGGPLIVGLENAWTDGSQKDKAAAGKGS
ncbi:putative T7SS-secreted protein [Kitasatospora sp. NPDC050467]|uniref:putative T7SS-secreted protein n=1 Tax=Kitasatospora sp. NPDC050467 TaxID=3364053 RepID=UPI00379BF81F